MLVIKSKPRPLTSQTTTIILLSHFSFSQPDSVKRFGFHQQPLGSASVHAALQHPGVPAHDRHWPLQSLFPSSPHPAPLAAAQPYLV